MPNWRVRFRRRRKQWNLCARISPLPEPPPVCGLLKSMFFLVSERLPSRGSIVIPTGSSLERIVSGALRQAAPEQTPILAWPLACGSAVAGRTRVLEFADGVLRVQVADAG